MASVTKRRITRTGTSLTITLPSEFVRQHKLKAGDEVSVLYDDWLQVVPFKPIEVVEEVSDELLDALREVFDIPEGEPVIVWDKDLRKEVKLVSKSKTKR